MINASTFPPNAAHKEPEEPLYPPQQNQKKENPKGMGLVLSWWYGLTSPAQPDESAPFEERELFRRGRTGSQIAIVLFLLLIISYPAAFAGSNSLLITILTIDILLLMLALTLNRLKRVGIAGIIVVLVFTASPTMNILTTPGGVNTSALPVFGFLVIPLMCAASFLAPWWVFVVAAGNCLFTIFVLTSMPSQGELQQVLKVAFPGIVTPILLSQMIVSIVAFLWVRGARQALQRADRAEEIARLESLEIKRQEEQLAVGRQIEEGIQQIIATMGMVVTRNDFSIRVPLSQENILWRVSNAVNNLLSRLQGFRRSQEELKRTHAVAAAVAQRIREGQPIALESWTGTAFDPVIIEYNRQLKSISTPSSPRSQSVMNNGRYYSDSLKD
ncbi:MAG: hypothetical protein E6J34_07095 [Chloroflexi bacterium]|nr:MAG: hypothetical protein E6J34_07095 [Chloroflexota bacterium]